MSVTYETRVASLQDIEKRLIFNINAGRVLYLTRLVGELVALVPSSRSDHYVWVWLETTNGSGQRSTKFQYGHTDGEIRNLSVLAKQIKNGDWIFADVDITVKIQGEYAK